MFDGGEEGEREMELRVFVTVGDVASIPHRALRPVQVREHLVGIDCRGCYSVMVCGASNLEFVFEIPAAMHMMHQRRPTSLTCSYGVSGVPEAPTTY